MRRLIVYLFEKNQKNQKNRKNQKNGKKVVRFPNGFFAKFQICYITVYVSFHRARSSINQHHTLINIFSLCNTFIII